MKAMNTLPSALYLDLEMNCHDRSGPGANNSEIIEIGLAELDVISLEIVQETTYLVRPRAEITKRCTKITGLTTEDLKNAKPFKVVIGIIHEKWPNNATCITWGDDEAILERACRENRVTIPFRRFIDLSQIVRQVLLMQDQLSVRSAMELLGLQFDGCAHMAVADARNTARIHAEIIRRLRTCRTDPVPSCEPGKPALPTWFGQLLERSLKANHLA